MEVYFIILITIKDFIYIYKNSEWDSFKLNTDYSNSNIHI